MKKLFLSIIVLISIVIGSCKRNAEVVRELHYIDLLSPENKEFQQYPNEFSTYLLKGILNEELPAYFIDYDSSGSIIPLQLSVFVQKIIEPYEDYETGESTLRDAYGMEDVSGFVSSVTLLGLDELVAEDESYVQYINFYHPGDVTVEGLNRYICSIEFESAIEYLNSKYSPLLWNNYMLEEWGWYKQRLFIPQTRTSSKMAHDILTFLDNSILASKLDSSITTDRAQYLAKESPYNLVSSFEPDGEGRLMIAYKDDSLFFNIGQFTFEDVLITSRNKDLVDSVTIVPVTQAILSNGLKKQKKLRTVSSNGEFLKPLEGPDEVAGRRLNKVSIDKSIFSGSEKFYFRTIERLLGEQSGFLFSLPSILYDGVREGEITVYESDTLKSRLLPGEFFDNMMLSDQDNLIADKGDLEVYQVITQTIFNITGVVDSPSIVGIGIFIPGNIVPEGINRPIGYFRIEDVNELLGQNGLQSISESDMRGFPLKSWNLELYQQD